jgi:ABC-type Fe3+ transport system permease subunit
MWSHMLCVCVRVCVCVCACVCGLAFLGLHSPAFPHRHRPSTETIIIALLRITVAIDRPDNNNSSSSNTLMTALVAGILSCCIITLCFVLCVVVYRKRSEPSLFVLSMLSNDC